MNSNELRQQFLEFFRSKGHEIVASAPMVIKNDPTLMFTNAGMNQFKDIFLGNRQPKSLRTANSQKCLRVSGKHNDLEEVGHDTYHHTMFEMLGNWSFGDYFKKEAVEWAWEFLTEKLGIPQDRLYTTIFEGSPEENVPRDDEAFMQWEKCFGTQKNRILEGSKKDNFWEMGDTGPCGPCSEIHVDIREEKERAMIPGHELINTGHPLVIEIWNLVFIQYNRKADGSLETLPAKHVDTGMGFERLCMIVQGKRSNYDTDIFQSLFSVLGSITGKKYGESPQTDIAMRVVADHLRAVAFSVADGQIPSNNKAGYVIRRILRRAIRYGYNYLGAEEPFIYRLVPALVKSMGGNYPELANSEDHISRIIHEEESSFLKTLGKGLRMTGKIIAEMKEKNNDLFPGKIAFELYDTYGFPVDLTQLILKENGMRLDMQGFEKEMAGQKQRSRDTAVIDAGDWIIVRETPGTIFTGYENTEDDVLISKYRIVKVKGKEVCHIVLNLTPFYAESGGQTGDSGYLISEKEKIMISDTVKENDLIIHVAEKAPVNPDAEFRAVADREKRMMTAANHTATHLLHHALRSVLGSHVEQKGSLVTPERLRFDFSHFNRISRDELSLVELTANRLVMQNLSRKVTENISLEKAKEMGAMALFGEKYGETVRVIGFGDSVELCGGTHIESTSGIGLIKIVSEGAIAAGIRRIEAVTGVRAYEYINDKLAASDDVAALLKTPGNIREGVEKLIAENSSLRKTIEKYQLLTARSELRELERNAEDLGNIKFMSGLIDVDSAEMLKTIAFEARKSSGNSVMVIGSASGDKANIVVMVSDILVKNMKLNAVEIIKAIAPEISGGGGGQPFLASAGGKNPGGIPAAIRKAKEYILRLKNN
ncbi:MAG TPA: alanine--tRNA ligase [Bacteroidales bacterium]|nr:alanine--tRNA ligase [Bacteroidales bacterium]HPJ59157.1 alanine--tRNA ligase [Bacteroidales bacterium]